MRPEVSLIIPTHNRCACLRRALDAAARQQLPVEQYEIIVVDNGSSDDTRALVTAQARQILNLRYVYEPQPGLNVARNRGWREARGEIVVYQDDDAIGSPAWLATYREVFNQVRPTPGCAGGAIAPIWECPRPAWLPDHMLQYLTLLDYAPEPTVFPSGRWIYGANMAYPRSVLQEFNGFREGLDRRGGNLLSGGEVELQRRLQARGLPFYYHPRAAVRHLVPAERLRQQWFFRRLYWDGVTETLLARAVKPATLGNRLRFIYWNTMRLLQHPQRLLWSLWPVGPSAEGFGRKCSALFTLGAWMGAWRRLPTWADGREP